MPVARRVLLVVSALVVLLLGGLVYITATISWERSITIEAGPEEGFFYQTGKELADDLQSSGSVATVTSRDDTLRIIGNVQDAQNPVNVGFIAQEVDPRNYPSVMSLGSIVLEPLLFFAREDLGNDLSILDLEGRSVWMQVEGSGFDQLASDVFDSYGVEVERHYGPLSEGIASVRRGDTDVLGVLFPLRTPIVGQLANDPTMTLVNLPTTEALAEEIGYVYTMTVPPGLFSLSEPIPSVELNTVGLPVTVVAHKDLPPAIVIDIAAHLHEQFGSPLTGSEIGAFPNFLDSQLPPHPLAEDFYRSGIPWHYQALPGWLAEVFGQLVLLGSVAILLATIYKVAYPDFYGLWTKVLAPSQRRAVLDRVENLRTAGKPVPPSLVRQVNAWNREVIQERLDRERIASLSAALSDPKVSPGPPSEQDVARANDAVGE